MAFRFWPKSLCRHISLTQELSVIADERFSMSQETYEIAVIGGGLTGLTTAIALARACKESGTRIALVATQDPARDGRTTALLMPSVDFLKSLALWDGLQDLSAPLRTMRMIDATKRLIRAPLTDFKSAELGLEAFGYNVPNEDLLAKLEAACAEYANIRRFDAQLEKMTIGDAVNTLTLSDGGCIDAQLVAACDGRNSIARTAAEIDVRSWSYPQTALVTNFTHSRPHADVSAEFHTETGPFTQVPLPAKTGAKNRSSLVWVVKPEQAEVWLSRDKTSIESEIGRRMQNCLGQVTLENDLQAFPLSGMTARQFTKNRTVLLGEAAHVFPPIGAQGFNLGLRDVAALAALVENDPDISNPNAIASSYNTGRLRDVHMSTAAVDILNKSLLTGFLPVQLARAGMLSTIGQIGWLRRLIMRQGFAPGRMGNASR